MTLNLVDRRSELSDAVLLTHYEDNTTILEDVGHYLRSKDGFMPNVNDGLIGPWVVVIGGRFFHYCPILIGQGASLTDSVNRAKTFYQARSIPAEALDKLGVKITDRTRVSTALFLDIQMPFADGKTGLDVARGLDQILDYGVAVSSKNLENDPELRMLRGGAHWHYIRKPTQAKSTVPTSDIVRAKLAERGTKDLTGRRGLEVQREVIRELNAEESYALPRLIFDRLNVILDQKEVPINQVALQRR